MPYRRLLFALLAVVSWTSAALAITPPPYDPIRFAFPGSIPSPGDAASAALAGADRWLSSVAGGNPASMPHSTGVTLSPILQRISRQDLSAENREFSQTTFFLDGASGQLAWRAGEWGLRLEASQPMLRRETSTFSVAIGGAVTQPARVQVDAQARESRAALALSRASGAWRFGAAAELSQRSDRYTTIEVSGSPESGERELAFEGSALGGSAGATWSRNAESRWGIEVGAAARFVGAIDATFESVSELLSGTSVSTGEADRDATWEAGASARITVDPRGGHAWACLETRSAERWPGLSLASDRAAAWRIGYDYRDSATPWVVRVGAGQEVQPGTPEPRATAIGVGLGWRADDLRFDLGVTHRSIRRGEAPIQTDTRLVGSVGIDF